MKISIKIIFLFYGFLPLITYPLNNFDIVLKSKWKNLDNDNQKIIDFGGEWILVGSITFKKRSKEPIDTNLIRTQAKASPYGPVSLETQKELEPKVLGSEGAMDSKESLKPNRPRKPIKATGASKAKKQKKTLSTKDKRARAKELIKNHSKGDPQLFKANEMLAAFQESLRAYVKNNYLKVKLTRSSTTVLLKACELSESLNVSYETFVKAQFWAFDKWWGAAPKLHQIITTKGDYSAIKRVGLYQQAVSAGEHNPKRNLTNRVIPAPKIPLEVTLHKSDQQFAQFIKNWNLTPKEVFLHFAATPSEALLYFDKKWLKRNEIYQQMRASGEVA